MRSKLLPISLLTTIAVVLALTAAPAQGAPTPPAKPAGIWLLLTPSTTFDQAALAAAGRNKANTLKVLGTMSSAAKTGRLKALPGAAPARTSVSAKTDLDQLITRIQSGAVAATDPFYYPQRGNAGSGSLYWTNLNLDVQLVYCQGSCIVTDEVKTTGSGVRTDPGPATARFNYTLIYSPDAGNMTDTHVNSIPLCHGTTRCGNTTVNGTGAHSAYVTSSPSMANNHVAHAYELYVFGIPAGQGKVDGAKTGTAGCTTTTCKYGA